MAGERLEGQRDRGCNNNIGPNMKAQLNNMTVEWSYLKGLFVKKIIYLSV